MDSRGLYLNHWTPDFDPEMDVPSDVPVWVRLPYIPLHCWGDESIKTIGNTVGSYIDRCEPKDNMHACARICVEVDLRKGLPEAIKIKVDQWTHMQQLDSEQIPFKCKVCHEYGYFANRCLKKNKMKMLKNKKTHGIKLNGKNPPTSNLYLLYHNHRNQSKPTPNHPPILSLHPSQPRIHSDLWEKTLHHPDPHLNPLTS